MGGQVIEVKTPLTHRDYSHLVDQEVKKTVNHHHCHHHHRHNHHRHDQEVSKESVTSSRNSFFIIPQGPLHLTKTLSMFLFKIPQDPLHLTINKIRRCFMYNNQYFQLDIYKEPCHPRFGNSHVIQRIGNVILLLN